MSNVTLDFKSRIKNPIFWVNIILSIGAPILAYYGISPKDVTSWSGLFDIIKNSLSNPYVVVMIVIAVWNTIINPVTKGVFDPKN